MTQKQFKIGLSNTDKQNMAQDVYERVLALTFAEYDSAETYNEGDFVVYNDLLYKCLADNVTGTWDATKWQQATLQDLLDDVEGAVASADGKANVDGNYPTMTVGMADNLTPYDESAGDDQDEPFGFQATGTGNGSQPDFATGSGALMKEKQGNTVCVNQKLRNNNFESTQNWYGSQCDITVSNNVITAVGTSENSALEVYASIPDSYKENHYYLAIYTYKLDVNSNISKTKVVANNSGATMDYINVVKGSKQTEYFVYKATQTSNNGVHLCQFNFLKQSGAITGETVELYFVALIDLTQWFNGNIPQDILVNPENFFRYYQGSLAYNTGELVNANSQYIKCIGMNQFDGTNDVKAIPNATYYINGSATLTYKDREGNTISSESKSNQTFVAPSNCLSIGVSGSGNISINLYYEDEPRCLTYEPYQVLTNNDTGTEVLRSAGSVKDYKTPNGIIHRIVGVLLDLGSMSFTVDHEHHRFYTQGLASVIKLTSGSDDLANISCDKYPRATVNDILDGKLGIGVSAGGAVSFSDIGYESATEEQFKTAMANVKVYYELATPLPPEQGTPYSENLVIDDFGSMDFQGTNGVPQGNLIFYPVDYKAFIDTLYNYTDGTPSNIALKSDLAVVNEKIGAKLPECTTTTAGTYVLKATVADGEVVYAWVLEE